jgi:hypothetical protein
MGFEPGSSLTWITIFMEQHPCWEANSHSASQEIPVKLTIHFHLAPRSKNAWSYTSISQYAFVAWCQVKKSTGTTLLLPYLYLIWESRDSSVGIALGYGLDDRGSRVRFPAGAWNFSLHHRVQYGSRVHPASYPMGTRSFFPGGKAAGAWTWPLTSVQCRGQRMSGAIPSPPNTPSWRGA